MTPHGAFLHRVFPSIIILLVVAVLQGCFNPTYNYDYLELCAEVEDMDYAGVFGNEPEVVFEDEGTIKVMHGYGRASHYGGNIVRVEQGAELPGYANQATVFLNGWELEYAGDDDQPIAALATAITRIRIARGRITWDAIGYLGDEDRDKAYDWSYRYTIVAWNDTQLHATVDHNDAQNYCETGEADGSDNFFQAYNSRMSTALSCYPTFLSNPAWLTGETVAVLPRGFGIGYGDPDHRLLQVGYHLDSVEAFVQSHGYYKARYDDFNPLNAPPDGRAGRGFVSWNSYSILKDEDLIRGGAFAEVVSGLGGPDVGLIQPAFSIQPQPSRGGLATEAAILESRDVVIDNIPYAYAIPMLTGWDLHFVYDSHVKQVGIWLDDLSYDLPAGATGGTLRYRVSSVLRDDDGFPSSTHRHNVAILGFRAINDSQDPVDGGKYPTHGGTDPKSK